MTAARSKLVVLLGAVLLAACASTGGSLPSTSSPTADSTGSMPTTTLPPDGMDASTSTTGAPSPPSTTVTTPPPTTTSIPAGSTTAAPTTGPFGVRVLSVTDGDTIRVLVDGASEPLRLIGINAPESGECLAAEATRRLAELVGEDPVRLEADVSDRDDFGRLLRYVYSADVLVNEVLVREGLALARRYQPDTTRSDQLEAAQAAAEREGVGMWDPAACGATAEGSIAIGRIHYDAAGDDNANLNDEWVEITNAGDASVDLTGWSVKDESATHRYPFPSGFHLDAGATVRIHTGCGPDAPTALHWCMEGSAVWNNSGDTVFVLDPSGNVVASESYTD